MQSKNILGMITKMSVFSQLIVYFDHVLIQCKSCTKYSFIFLLHFISTSLHFMAELNL